MILIAFFSLENNAEINLKIREQQTEHTTHELENKHQLVFVHNCIFLLQFFSLHATIEIFLDDNSEVNKNHI